MFISERRYDHLVKTLVDRHEKYKYYDLTAIEPNYGVFHMVLSVAIIAVTSQDVIRFVLTLKFASV